LVAENILRSPDVSKDIVQEVFTAVWQNRERLHILYPKAYLQQAIRFQVLKAIRSDRTDSEFYKRLAQVSQDMVVENTLSYKELQRTVEELVQSLPDDCRQAFRLSREQNLTYHQIAERLNISVKTVEKKMSQSLRYLRIALHNSEISH
jgi:RNA polymerase sigma-70 factor (ECF subfamily)